MIKYILEKVKVGEYDYDYMLQFFKETKTMHAKLVSEPYISTLYKFNIKIYLESFIYLSFVSFIWNHL